MVSQYSLSNIHFLDDHLSEISSSEIVIIEKLGSQLHGQQVMSWKNRDCSLLRFSVFASVSSANWERENSPLFSMKKIRKKITPSECEETRLLMKDVLLCRYFSLSKLINHWNLVRCLGYVNVSPERCLLISEHSRVNLFDYCQTMSRTDEQTLA